MKQRIIKLSLILTLAFSCMFMSACESKKEPEEVVTLYNNTWVMEHYMDAVQDYDMVLYEQVYFDWGKRSIGPTEYRFRGFIVLTAEEAERLMKYYKWDETDAPDFEFDQLDTGFIGEGPWYSSPDFNKDNYKSAVDVKYTVFDGQKLVFDFNQM